MGRKKSNNDSSGVDAHLIKLVQQGDKEAFDLLVDKYQYRIINIIQRYVFDSSDAFDIAQETFIRAYKALYKFRGDSAFFTWLYRIAINTAKNYAVNNVKRVIEVDMEKMDFDEVLNKHNIKDYTGPEGLLLMKEMEAVILDVVDELPKDLKTAFTLREIDGMTYEEIAGIMACPIGTVRSRIYRAREFIEKRLKPIVSDK